MRFLEYAYQSHGGFGRTITIGRQQLTFPAREVFGYLGVSAVSPDLPFVDDLIARAFGASEVASIDASSFEGATYVRDLNKPLEVGFPQFDTVIDGGSLEHIFDVRASLANVAAICATGGQILHIVPANNFMGHGFYQFSPELFLSLYTRDRGFTETSVFLADLASPRRWWRVRSPDTLESRRATAMSRRETYLLVRARKTGAPGTAVIQQSDYLAAWNDDGGSASPSGLGAIGIAAFRRLPEVARSRLAQGRRQFATGLSGRNPALERVRPPGPRRANT